MDSHPTSLYPDRLHATRPATGFRMHTAMIPATLVAGFLGSAALSAR
jgi:hypothetical protein